MPSAQLLQAGLGWWKARWRTRGKQEHILFLQVVKEARVGGQQSSGKGRNCKPMDSRTMVTQRDMAMFILMCGCVMNCFTVVRCLVLKCGNVLTRPLRLHSPHDTCEGMGKVISLFHIFVVYFLLFIMHLRRIPSASTNKFNMLLVI